MIMRITIILKNIFIGDCINVYVPQFDLERDDPANIIEVILNIKDGMYEICTRGGKI